MPDAETAPQIVQTNDGRLFRVRDAGADIPQAWFGTEVKRVRGGFADKAKARETLVRKACSAVVREAV